MERPTITQAPSSRLNDAAWLVKSPILQDCAKRISQLQCRGDTPSCISAVRVVESLTMHEVAELSQRLALWRECVFSWAVHALPQNDYSRMCKCLHLLPSVDRVQIEKDVKRTSNWLQASEGAPVLTTEQEASRLQALGRVLRAHAVRAAILNGHVQVRSSSTCFYSCAPRLFVHLLLLQLLCCSKLIPACSWKHHPRICRA